MELSKDTMLGDLLDRNPQAAQVLAEMGMHCTGCPASRGETLEEACQVHGIDCGHLLAKLSGQ